MPPDDHARAFGNEGNTGVNPIALGAMIVAILLLFALPRKYAAVPILIVILVVPGGQGLVLGGAHFFINRVVILAGLARFVNVKWRTAGAGKSIDGLVIGCYMVSAIATTLLFLEVPAFVNQVAVAIDTIGAFVLLRILIQSEEDASRAMKCLSVVVAILALGMVIEAVKNVNLFYYIGGGRLVPDVREGKVRCQGPFSHALTAGTFAGTVLPLFLFSWSGRTSKFFNAMGVLGATLMTVATNTSTSMIAYLAAILGVCMWPVRKSMRMVRWGIVGTLILLALVMKAPVWFIIAHIDLTGSSSSYHRAAIIDAFVNHFRDWWMLGIKDASTWGWDIWDAQNQFVCVGENGGLLALILFIAAITRCFSRLGRARKYIEGDRNQEWKLWCIGATLFANVVGFFGVNYFDQSQIYWFLLLATIMAVTHPILTRGPLGDGTEGALSSAPNPSSSESDDNWAYAGFEPRRNTTEPSV